jgi:hypothetical protein
VDEAGAVEDESVTVEEDAAAVEDETAAVEEDAAAVEDEAAAVEDEAAAVEEEAAAAEDEAVPVADEVASMEDEVPLSAGGGLRPTSPRLTPRLARTASPPLITSARPFSAELMCLLNFLEGLTAKDVSLSIGPWAPTMPCATVVWLLERGEIRTTVQVEKEGEAYSDCSGVAPLKMSFRIVFTPACAFLTLSRAVFAVVPTAALSPPAVSSMID